MTKLNGSTPIVVIMFVLGAMAAVIGFQEKVLLAHESAIAGLQVDVKYIRAATDDIKSAVQEDK